MRIICFTDNMGSGGAQRQLSFLAILLARRGHDVTVITYNKGAFFDQFLSENNIKRIRFDCKFKYQIPLRLWKIFRVIEPDGVIAFQTISSLYAEIASLFGKKWKLIVSERNLKPKTSMFYESIKVLHFVSDAIVTNSHTTRYYLASKYGFLKTKLHTIYNGVDLDKFKPATFFYHQNYFRLVVLASHSYQKNFASLAKALKLLETDSSLPQFQVDWYGGEAPGWLRRNTELARSLGLKCINIYPPTHCVHQELNNAHALILPSLYEGLPNVVCEALSCGCPVLMSNVCDAKFLVADGESGFLFDPNDPRDIAEVLKKFILLPCADHMYLRKNARSSAERLFNPEAFCHSFERLITNTSESITNENIC